MDDTNAPHKTAAVKTTETLADGQIDVEQNDMRDVGRLPIRESKPRRAMITTGFSGNSGLENPPRRVGQHGQLAKAQTHSTVESKYLTKLIKDGS
jgi:hypothetical protein